MCDKGWRVEGLESCFLMTPKSPFIYFPLPMLVSPILLCCVFFVELENPSSLLSVFLGVKPAPLKGEYRAESSLASQWST